MRGDTSLVFLPPPFPGPCPHMLVKCVVGVFKSGWWVTMALTRFDVRQAIFRAQSSNFRLKYSINQSSKKNMDSNSRNVVVRTRFRLCRRCRHRKRRKKKKKVKLCWSCNYSISTKDNNVRNRNSSISTSTSNVRNDSITNTKEENDANANDEKEKNDTDRTTARFPLAATRTRQQSQLGFFGLLFATATTRCGTFANPTVGYILCVCHPERPNN